ncbi:molybdenum cofactor biosynthesis protein MoaE [Lysinibacillus fusiformis]|uniref:Molybdopterin synthase catalytic subunit n=1 Tax=Lysinibacillus fusiformis TaxID=28031 RepID=A0A1H9K3N4_9BACI|nr:molybdenum cofactor biosynthesis protein MoaE [Lysinibacillus fusiformis]SCY47255.1 molybdopterin synthase subunit MoaE [Lysinibacillus fusiformis]SEN85879.1 molybdopterin synthase subunit MoaE [Lysinibacillus fusiformis]SEQ93811.1 molybdopterin synthase subunit MoaE [Lysinibacillus fusiformis]
MTTAMFEIIDKPIDVEEVRHKVLSGNAGAITLFIGTVREITQGKKTLYLEYQAYPAMAIKMFEQIAQELKLQWPEAEIAITHRVGRLDITDIAVVIAVSSPHRKVAYLANEYAIDRIKQIVPIWKKEHWEDGTQWIGDQLENVPYSEGKPAIDEEGKL